MCIIDCLRCYAACFERFIAFLNRNAYIQIALTGDNFCTAAKNGFELVMSNPGKFSIISGLGGFFTFLGSICITAGTTCICYYIITTSSTYKNNLYSPVLPTIFFAIIAFFVSSLFMNIYGIAIDTILQCAIVDEEVHKAENSPPKFCPEPLRDFFAEYDTSEKK